MTTEADLFHRRYAIVPQMQDYNSMGQSLLPYLTFASPRNYASSCVTTDSYGFRRSSCDDRMIDTDTLATEGDCNIVLGGSYVFGVGASSDSGTLPSWLAGRTGRPWINLGIRGGNSLQEHIAAIPFAQHTDRLVIATGVNNLVTWYQNSGENELFAPLFGEHVLARLGELPLSELAAIASDPYAGAPLGSLAARRVVKHVKTRLGLNRRRDASSAVLPPLQLPREEELAAVYEKSIRQQARDVEMLVSSTRATARVVLAAQPFLATAGGLRTGEELELCAIWDGLDRAREQWEILKAWLTATWPPYVRDLRALASRLEIGFVDLNGLAYSGWSFVDHVHMNDNGYRQAADMLAGVLT